MRAMVLKKTGPIESSPLERVDNEPDPSPGRGEVRMRVSCCAICRTDLHIVEGDLPMQTYPIIPGHQVVGVVDRLGPAVLHLRVGDRIGIAWLRYTCGHCRFCTSGRENLCELSLYTGYHVSGGYAELAIVHEDFA